MKLPADKKERNKVLVLIGIGMTAVVYGLFVGVAGPLLKHRAARRAMTVQYKDKAEKAQRRIASAQRDRIADQQLVADILKATVQDRAVVRPRLGNYLLVATEEIEASARRAGTTVQNIKEESLGDLPLRAGVSNDHPFRVYTVAVQMQGSLADLVGLVADIEQNNPYACVSRVEVGGQPAKPAAHDIALSVQWPVWANPDADAQLEKLTGSASGGATP